MTSVWDLRIGVGVASEQTSRVSLTITVNDGQLGRDQTVRSMFTQRDRWVLHRRAHCFLVSPRIQHANSLSGFRISPGGRCGNRS